jgi:tetratricopeptide (TPR) repeat protein
MGKMTRWLTGWSDFVFTIAEAVLPRIGLTRAAIYVAERHYATGLHGPGAKELVLADIYELAGDASRAETYLRSAIALRPNVPNFRMHLGQFFMRRKQPQLAIREFEQALTVAQNPDDVDFVRGKIAELRSPRSAS